MATMEKSAEAGVESPQISSSSNEQLNTDDINPAIEKPTEAHQPEAEGDSHWITGRKVAQALNYSAIALGQGFLVRTNSRCLAACHHGLHNRRVVPRVPGHCHHFHCHPQNHGRVSFPPRFVIP